MLAVAQAVGVAANRMDVRQRPDELDRVAAAYDVLGLRFDAARTRLASGRAQRRHRKWAAARAALDAAQASFAALGSPGWEAQTGGSVMMV